MMQEESFQLSVSAAQAYEATFVPALFAEWAPLVVEAGKVTRDAAVLDIGCGTGVVARAAMDRTGPSGRVVGVDINDAMLTVARDIRRDIDWRVADASRLPFPDDSFDVVLSQAALMFVPHPDDAVREMGRVVKDSGTVAVQVWAALESQPAYGRLVDIAARHAGGGAVDLLSSYWRLGHLDRLGQMFTDNGLTVTRTATHIGTARFDSVDELVKIEVESTPLGERIDDHTYEAILRDARRELALFQVPDAKAAFPIVGHILTARPC